MLDRFDNGFFVVFNPFDNVVAVLFEGWAEFCMKWCDIGDFFFDIWVLAEELVVLWVFEGGDDDFLIFC